MHHLSGNEIQERDGSKFQNVNKHTVQAIAVSTATSMWPLYKRSLQPPPAFFSRLYHEEPSEAVGRKKSIKKLIDSHSGR